MEHDLDLHQVDVLSTLLGASRCQWLASVVLRVRKAARIADGRASALQRGPNFNLSAVSGGSFHHALHPN